LGFAQRDRSNVVRKNARTFIYALGMALIAGGEPANAQMALPEGPNRTLVTRTCTTCHDLGMVLGTGGRSREGWNNTVEDMIAYGMSISDADRRLVVDYLATFLPTPGR
jgi:cytochrome c5